MCEDASDFMATFLQDFERGGLDGFFRPALAAIVKDGLVVPRTVGPVEGFLWIEYSDGVMGNGSLVIVDVVGGAVAINARTAGK